VSVRLISTRYPAIGADRAAVLDFWSFEMNGLDCRFQEAMKKYLGFDISVLQGA
jgi:hypothetical protein